MSVSEPEYITIGEILAPWGVSGQVKVAPATDFPERFTPESKVYLNHRETTIDHAEWLKDKVVIKLGSVNSPEEAKKLRGQVIEIHRSQLQTLPEGHYYLFQIIGLEAWTTEGTRLGSVIDVQTAPSNDNYVVSGAGEELLIPAIDDVVKDIDLERGRIIIEPIEGLLNLNARAEKKPSPKKKKKPASPGKD